jgi:hypothetical protein
MKEQTLTRQELYDLIWSFPLLTLAKKYSITDVGLRKMCIRMCIPLPNYGHWMQVKYNKKIKKKNLPKDYKGESEVTLRLREEGEGMLSPFVTLQREIIKKEGDTLIVPEKLSKPSKLITDAKESLTKDPNSDWRYKGLLYTKSNDLNISVTQANINRALRFMDTFIKVIENRNHKIITHTNSTILLIKDEKVEIYLREKFKKVVYPEAQKWPRFEFLPTGILMFSAKVFTYDLFWQDGNLPLEKQLARIIARIEIKTEETIKEKKEREEKREREREKKRIEEEKQKRKERELDDFVSLIKSSKRWHKAENLRRYIDEVEANSVRTKAYSDEVKNWVSWARQKANWYDPFVLSDDEYLNEVDRDKLVFKKPPKEKMYWEN